MSRCGFFFFVFFLGVVLSAFIPLGSTELFMCKIMFFTKPEKFSDIISSNTFSPPFSCPFYSRTSFTCMLDFFIFSHSSLRFYSSPPKFFPLLLRLNIFIDKSSSSLTLSYLILMCCQAYPVSFLFQIL